MKSLHHSIANHLRLFACTLLVVAGLISPAVAQVPGDAVPVRRLDTSVPMSLVGPQSRAVDTSEYARTIHVAPNGDFRTVSEAIASIANASADHRDAVLVAAGTYHESSIRMKPHVDLFGGFAPGDWSGRDVCRHASIVDAHKKGPVVIGADDARLDGFVVTGGQHDLGDVVVDSLVAQHHDTLVKRSYFQTAELDL